MTQPIPARAADLISKMALEEKVTQLLHESKAIDRLDIPEYNRWNECQYLTIEEKK